MKTEILRNLCYTELVYGRINKKLHTQFSPKEIEAMIFKVIVGAHEDFFEKNGKNTYISDTTRNIRITINTSSFRVITVDIIDKSYEFTYN